MKKLLLGAIILFTSISFANAQKVGKVTITTKTSIAEALEQCKEAGKKEGYGSRDYEASANDGKLTLWANIGKSDFYCQVTATQKDGITTLVFRMPHNPNVLANYKKELKKLVEHLQLPEKMVGEYFDGIE